jgi:hypothetical protein
MMDVPEIESYSSLSHGKVGADVTVRCTAARTPRGSKQTKRRKIRVTIRAAVVVQWYRTFYVVFLQRTCIGGGPLHQWA